MTKLLTMQQVANRVWLPGVICALALLFVAGATDFGGDAKKFPATVGLLTAALALIEAVLRGLEQPAKAARPTQAPAHNNGTRGTFLGIWFAATLSGFYVLGVLPAIAISAVVYFYAFVRRCIPWALCFGGAHALFFFIAFELLAGFRLHEGLFNS